MKFDVGATTFDLQDTQIIDQNSMKLGYPGMTMI